MINRQPSPGVLTNFTSPAETRLGSDYRDELVAGHSATLGDAGLADECHKPDAAAKLDGEVGSLEHAGSPFAGKKNTEDRADLLTEVPVAGRAATPPPRSHVEGVANTQASASVSLGRESVGREPDHFVSAHLSPAPTVRLGAGAPSSQDHSRLGYFGDLVAEARLAADKATRKFPQPNYVTLKIAEEAGEVVRGAVHYAEGRMRWEEVKGEIVQLLAMLIRFVTEGDEINGVRPPALATTEGSDNG